MAKRLEALILGVGNAVFAAALIYGLATGAISGFGYAALAAVGAFVAVVWAVQVALLGVRTDA